jgi:hypothetical protein
VVVGHIHGLHHDFANTRAHSEWLQRFQQAPEAWAVVHELLTSSTDEQVLYFGAHTLVTKLQAGHLPNGGTCKDLIQFLSRFLKGPQSVRRQLVVALVDFALWRPSAEDEKWLTDCVQHFSSSPDGIVSLLELLEAIPEEAVNRKVVVEAQRRQNFAANMLRHTNTVLEALWKSSQASDICAVLALRAFTKWLSLQHSSPALRAQKKSGGANGAGRFGAFTADILKQGALHEHALVQQAARIVEAIGTANLDLARACGDLLSEMRGLTNETSPQARAIAELVARAVVSGAKQLLPAAPSSRADASQSGWMMGGSELVLRLAVIGRLVSELGGPFARFVIADGIDRVPVAQAAIFGELAEVALNFCLLHNIELAKCGLDFWYAALAQHLGAVAEEDDPYDEDAGVAVLQRTTPENWAPRNPDQEKQRRAEEAPYIAPHIQSMVKALWRAVRFPAEPEHEANFEWDEFVRFRETCSTNITEACVVVTPRWIIEHIGVLLEEICSQGSNIAWQDIDACVFVLTGVASRAPAGQDTVIPRLIELLPQLPYPTEGFKAMLLRCAASRLVLFTSGYLALQEGPCKLILQFLTTQHLPAIPALKSAPDVDARKYCEAIACDAVKMVMTAARKAIVIMDGGTLWKDVVTAVINLVSDKRFNVDCRAQMVFGIGQVLSVLSDWGELEHMLGLFVSRMQEPLKPILDALPAQPLGGNAVKTTQDGKAPLELKLYIASVSSVYNIPALSEEALRPDHHPVLAVVERHFQTIEIVCIHHTQYEDLMEQVCLAFSYILGFAREYAPNSQVFVPMMKLMARCCEQHPQPFYMGLVRSVVGFFAAAGNEQLDAVLVDLTGLFVAPIARRLASDCVGGGGLTHHLPPPLNAAAYEMLAETLRHWNLTLLAIRSAQWMTETLDATLEILPRLAEDNQAVHEKTVCAMLRFLRNVLLWADHEMTRCDPNAPELKEVQNHAQALIGERPLPHGVALPRIIVTIARLLAAAAPNGPAKGELVPCVAEVLRTLFTGPFEYPTSSQLPNAFRILPKPLAGTLGDADTQRLVQQMKMEKGDSRRFVRTIIGLAEQFAVTLKRAQFAGEA